MAETGLDRGVEIVCVGTELLSGKVNTHAAYLSVLLRQAGLDPRRELTVTDSLEDIRQAVAAAAERSAAVLVCGGLGPTFDDLTREGVAAALRRRLVYSPALFESIRRRFLRFGLKVPASNKRQAWVIEGARVLPNAHGSAPGQLLTLPGKHSRLVALMPGPFSELKPMFERYVLPELRRRYGGGLVSRRLMLRFCGISEAAADMRLKALLKAHAAKAEFTILAGLGSVDLHASARAATAREAEARLARIRRGAERLLGSHLYGGEGDTLESAAGRRLLREGRTLAVAESCTGGLLGQRLSSVPGSSRYFLGGAIAYHNKVKTGVLGVRPKTLARHGAVSAQCAGEMAEGARLRMGSDIGVSITGIAGPGGGTPKKPVGLVYMAWALPGRKPIIKRFLFPGDRAQVRERAASAALYRLYRLLD